jgi:signal transduction histidine kinase
VGILIAGYRSRKDPFRSQQQRILRGIGQLASIALENACLFEELEWANHLKSDFVATMSHELRTPLNIIMGYGDLLRDGEFGGLNPQQLDTLNRMDHSAKNLLELINATLDVSRLEGGRAPLQLRDVVVRDLMAEIMVEAAELCHKSDLTVTWNVAPDLPLLWTDPVKLKVVIKNLVANAVKFTPRGSVTVDVHPCSEGVEVAVTDTGIGIAPEVMPIIFEPFRQGESGATRRFAGVGLGLYIVQRLVDMLGATIFVESEVNRGSRFRVVHPLRAGQGARPAAVLTQHCPAPGGPQSASIATNVRPCST